MAPEELDTELADVQQQLEGMVCRRLSARVDPQRARRYGLLLAREELLLLERHRRTMRRYQPAPQVA